MSPASFNFFGTKKTANDGDAAEGDDEPENLETPIKKDAAAVTMASVAYIVRAVTPGTFIHPAATIEDMYRPERYARSAAGKLTVTAKQ